MTNKIANFTIAIPYKRAGNVISQEPVQFDVYRDEEVYRLIPRLSEDDRRIANLPPVLEFTMQDGKPVSRRGKKDGNLHVIEDSVALLKAHNKLV